MKKLFTLLTACLIYAAGFAQTGLQTFYDFSDTTIEGTCLSMGQYTGKKVMVVNVASFCVYTPQYTQLDILDSLYGQQYNFTIIGFPCNDFLNQGGTNQQIIGTAQTYNVKFQLMETVHTVTGDTTPLYKWLQRADLNGVSNATVDWNFNKFLIDEQGHWSRHYASAVEPLDTGIVNWITGYAATGINEVTGNNLVALRSANPGNTSVDMVINTAAPQHYNIQMFSIDGQLAGTLYNGSAAGAQVISYPVNQLASGTYLIKIEADNGVQTLKYCVQR